MQREQRRVHVESILLKGPYLPSVSMAGRALLAGYHWCIFLVLSFSWILHLIPGWLYMLIMLHIFRWGTFYLQCNFHQMASLSQLQFQMAPFSLWEWSLVILLAMKPIFRWHYFHTSIIIHSYKFYFSNIMSLQHIYNSYNEHRHQYISFLDFSFNFPFSKWKTYNTTYFQMAPPPMLICSVRPLMLTRAEFSIISTTNVT